MVARGATLEALRTVGPLRDARQAIRASVVRKAGAAATSLGVHDYVILTVKAQALPRTGAQP